MTPDEQARDAQRIDGLLTSYGELLREVGEHDVTIRAHGEGISHLRDAQREAVKDFQRVLTEFDASCDRKVARVETAFVDFSKAMRAENDALARKIDEQAKARQWTPMVKAAVLGPTCASIIAAVALVVTKGT